MLRIALVNGDPAIRAGHRLMIDAQANQQLVLEEADAQIALDKLPELLVDVIVIDHRLKGFDGLALASRLVDAFAEKGELCPTIVITGTYATPELVMASIRCGASDVVTQDAPMSELLLAINNAGKDRTLADFSSFDEVLNHADYLPKPDPLFVLRRSQLTEKQKDVLNLMDRGLSLQQVRQQLRFGEEEFKLFLDELLIALRLGTYEQLYLALHDARQ